MVIVVDGSPDRRTEEAARAWAGSNHAPFDLTYIASPAGLTRQRNVGLDAAEGDYLFFLDDDCLPKPGYFREIRRVFTEDEAGRVGAVAGCIINGLNRRLPLRWRLRMLLGLVRPSSGRVELFVEAHQSSGSMKRWIVPPQVRPTAKASSSEKP